MTRFGDFLNKQSRFLLENDYVAFLCMAALAIIPFTAWLSAAIMALITLRKGWLEGFKGFVIGALAFAAYSMLTMPLSAALLTAVITFLPCYLTAAALHATASWKTAGFFIVLQALLAIMLVHWLVPDFIINQYRYIQAVMTELAKESSDSAVLNLLNNKNALNQMVIANYLLGVQAVSVVLSAVASLLLARSFQARLFYPGGFRQEMISFRANRLGGFLLAIALIGAYQHVPLAISSLPVLAVYYVFAGLSLGFNILAKKDKGIITLILLLIPLILIPFIMLPVYIIFGVLDSWFNFRIHLSNTGDKANKG